MEGGGGGAVFSLIHSSCDVEVCAYMGLQHQQRPACADYGLEKQGCGDQIPAFSCELASSRRHGDLALLTIAEAEPRQ